MARNVVSKGYVQMTSLTTVVGLQSIPVSAQTAIIQCEGQAVRWRDDGVEPTPLVGMPLGPGDVLSFDGGLSTLKFIEVAPSAKLNITYYS